MKFVHILHVIVTSLMLVTMLVVGVLLFTGLVEIRFPANRTPNVATPSALPSNAKARLLVVRGLKVNVEYPIFEGANFIGRADKQPVEIDLEDQEPPDRIWSSRQHALITCENGSLTIEDLGSANGTYVNRDIVPPGTKQLLKANDIIQIGAVQLKVVL